jgi:predicted methyltransferase|tara:strand:+ start:70 stop:243 length:174 start_codon:yes stop_codon:yes gene_type:complete
MDERDLESLMMSLVNEGIMEQYIGEDGQFYFGLTEFGKEVAQEISRMGFEEDDEDVL